MFRASSRSCRNLVKLNTNENPYPPSPRVAAAIAEELANGGESLRLYPDPNAERLKAAVAARYAEFGISPQQVFVGNGSDEVLAHVFMALLKHELPILFPDITYSFYPVYCGLYDIAMWTVPLDESSHPRRRLRGSQRRHHLSQPECADRLSAAACGDRASAACASCVGGRRR
jgi:histidinol-phosphate/aromatic aminotransferase/cobyric acid decarboxylase-like protein